MSALHMCTSKPYVVPKKGCLIPQRPVTVSSRVAELRCTPLHGFKYVQHVQKISKIFFLIKNRIEPQQNTSPFFLCVARYSRDISGANGKRRKQEVRRRPDGLLRGHSRRSRADCLDGGAWAPWAGVRRSGWIPASVDLRRASTPCPPPWLRRQRRPPPRPCHRSPS